jgi:integrase
MRRRKPRTGSIYPRGGVYWIKFYRRGKPVRESSHSDSYGDAERLLKRRQGEVVSGKFTGLEPERIRLKQLFDEVVEDYRLNERSSLGHLERRLKLHLRGAFAEIRAAEFGTSHVKKYKTDRRREGASNASINRELAIVKRAFHLGAASDPPRVARVPSITMLEENNVRKGFLEHDGYRRLRDELPHESRLLLVVAYHVGGRKGELMRIEWQEVDLRAKRITLPVGTTKNKEGRTLPIYGEMLEWLRMAREVRDAQHPNCDAVFARNGKAMKDFRKAWAAACKRAGQDGLLFHDLRRTAVRNMVRAGIPEKVAMQISGHKTRSVFDRYNIVSDRDLSDAAAKMERHLESLGTIPGTTPKLDKKPDAKNAAKGLN